MFMEKNIDQQFCEVMKRCDITYFACIIRNVLQNLNEYHDDFDYQSDVINGIKGYVTRKKDGRRCYIVARRYDIRTIDINEIRTLTDMLISDFLNDGIYITTTQFSKEVESLVKKSDMNIVLIDKNALNGYLSDEFKSKLVVNEGIEEIKVPRNNGYDEGLRERSSRSKLRVTFPDGTVFCDKSATRTMMQVIEHIGIAKVEKLGMESCHIRLITNEIVPKYEEWLKPIGDGYYLMTQSNTDQKYLQLTAIRNQLNMNFKIEMGSDFETVTMIGVSEKKKTEKTHLVVTFDDGTKIGDMVHDEPFIQAIEYIGIEKVIRAHITISGKPLITQTKQYNKQQQLSSGQWLMIPGTTKDKYKNLRVIAAMVHVKMNVEIV
jgi:hypothetical protein